MPTDAQNRLQQYLDAEAAILGGQEVRVSVGGTDRTLRMADLAVVQEQIRLLQRQVASEARSAAGTNACFSQADFG
jgi:hypothetical protein